MKKTSAQYVRSFSVWFFVGQLLVGLLGCEGKISADAQGAVDPCQNQTCGGHGKCHAWTPERLECICDPGYLANGMSCEPVTEDLIKEMDTQLDDMESPAGPDELSYTQDKAVEGGQRDCRLDYPEFPWHKTTKNECNKCWTCMGEGFLPGMAFVACKIEGKCYRFATVDNCNYNLCPKGKCSFFTLKKDPQAWCRKDGRNYTYYVCRVNGKKVRFQTVNAVNYYDKAERMNDFIGLVADYLPIIGGCIGDTGGASDTLP